jgi:hypothetical protein
MKREKLTKLIRKASESSFAMSSDTAACMESSFDTVLIRF